MLCQWNSKKTTIPLVLVLIGLLAASIIVLVGFQNRTVHNQDAVGGSPQKKTPFCKSGNEYLSLEGGAWIDTQVGKKGYDPSQISSNTHMDRLCYLEPGYNDTFQWRPPCDSYPFTGGESQRIKVLLWGDSLTNQIYNSYKRRQIVSDNDNQRIGNHIKYTMVQHREPYLTSSDGPFISSDSTCQEAINSNPIKFYLKNVVNESNLINEVFGDVTYDYVFFNTFAHFDPLSNNLWTRCAYKGLTFADVQLDVINHYEREVKMISRLMYEKFPTTKVYFRTSSPHVYEWTPTVRPLNSPPRIIGKKHCQSGPKGNKYLWKCAYWMNRVAAKAFLAYNHSILDSSPVMSMRVDAHPCSNPKSASIDCNHFCEPGPPDVMLEAIEAEISAREWEKVTALAGARPSMLQAFSRLGSN